jgi:hypothetical protein
MRRALLVALLLLLAAPRAARAEEVAASQQSYLVLRILSYDRNLKSRAGDPVHIGVLYKSGDKASEAAKTAIVAAIEEAAKRTNVSGMQVKLVAIPWSDAEAFESKTSGTKLAGLYVCAGLDGDLAAIAGVTRKRSILTFTAREAEVKGWLSVGLVTRSAKAAIMVNLPAAKAEGADLDSALLKVSEVLR